MDTVSEAAKGWSNPGVSSIYEKTRPDYNLDSVEFLLEKVGAFKPRSDPEPFTIVEIGAGTGKFTRAVLKVFEKRGVTNFKIQATEPLKEMCEKFKEMVPNVEICQCAAADLEDVLTCYADAVLAAQCFHWFGMDRDARVEVFRILKRGGMFGIIWNLPDRSVSWIKKLEELLDPKFEAIEIPRPAQPIMFEPMRHQRGFGKEGFDETTFKYSMDLDLNGIMQRYQGNSVVSAAPSEEKARILQAIEQEMKTNSDTKDKEIYTYSFYVKMHWFLRL